MVRPGLIVGPGDPSGRFSYWPERLAEGGAVLAPESPDLPAQVIDVRDLAGWIVTCAENRLTGVYDATGHASSLGVMLEEVSGSVGGDAELVWVDAGFLREHDVDYWAGSRSLPLWLPDEASGLAAHDVSAAVAAGLTTRPIAETARDTLDWLRSAEDPTRTGLTRAEERDLLDAWHTNRA